MEKKLYSKIHWRKYLDPNTSERVRKFIRSRGKEVFKSIVENIEKAKLEDIPELTVLVHPNVSSVVVIGEDDYDELLTHCCDYFESIEDYEECRHIIDVRQLQKQHVIEPTHVEKV